MSALRNWKQGKDYPSFLTKEGLQTLSQGYLQTGETPIDMYWRVSRAAAARLNKPELADKFFEYITKNWLCLASPIAANMGTERGLPISCYGMTVDDSISGICEAMDEYAAMSKNGGGVGIYWGDVRGRGSPITGMGTSNGVVPWLKIQDSFTVGVSQGNVRKGASVAYLPVEHPDVEEFLRVRRPHGDMNRQCLNINHAVTISDNFMKKVWNGDRKARGLWKEIMKTRIETGQPYLWFDDNVNRNRPEAYKQNDLYVKTSQLCNEIALHTDQKHSFVCCLSSLNLARYNEWKDTDLVETAIWFLDGVMSEFIAKAKERPGLTRAVRFSEKSRALGLGALGFHSLLQSEGTAFGSLRAGILNRAIFSQIRRGADKASRDLAEEYGEVEWTKGLGERNTHKLAIAPTVSNATMSSDMSGRTVSPSIEPWAGNVFTQGSAKGKFVRRNPVFEDLLDQKGKNNLKVWQSVTEHNGSCQHLDFLTDEEKEVFLTAKEINQMAVVRLAADRQKYLDQGQSVNLFFTKNAKANYINKVHLEAHKLGMYGLYYVRSESTVRGDVATKAKEEETVAVSEDVECKACEG